MTRNQFIAATAAVVLLAFGVREWFVLTMTVPNPTQGDVSAYLRYAMHMVLDGTFSMAEGGQPVIPDAYRSPGYPLLLAALYLLPTEWYSTVYQAQVLLGAATVLCVILLAREWLSEGWALGAGVWMALQTHHIAATGAMLLEVLFGFTIIAGLLCAAVALRRRSLPLAVLAGAVFAFGYLVNPVLAFVPLLLLPLFWRAGLRREGVAVALVMLVAIGGWAGRNAAVDAQGSGRAAINFVQGSWPEYHDAHKWPWRWPAKWEAINREVALIGTDKAAGIQAVADRMSADPARFVRWYALQKPFLLWDWEIRIGHGMAYTLNMQKTALDHGPLLFTTTLQWALNKLAFALAFVGLLLAIRQRGAAAMAALVVVYVTAVHVVLQAEPRYSIAYRSLEILLAVSAMAWLWSLLADRGESRRRAVGLIGGLKVSSRSAGLVIESNGGEP